MSIQKEELLGDGGSQFLSDPPLLLKEFMGKNNFIDHFAG